MTIWTIYTSQGVLPESPSLSRRPLRRTVRHKSSRRPLNTGWRTFPSADLARYSISANKVGSTHVARYVIFLVYGCAFRTNGLRRARKSLAMSLSKSPPDGTE
jgi:hypothetical protein